MHTSCTLAVHDDNAHRTHNNNNDDNEPLGLPDPAPQFGLALFSICRLLIGVKEVKKENSDWLVPAC